MSTRDELEPRRDRAPRETAAPQSFREAQRALDCESDCDRRDECDLVPRNLPLPTLACEVDRDGVVKGFSPAWARVLGVEHHRLVGSRFIDLIHPQDRDDTLAACRELASGKSVSGFRNRIQGREGTPFAVEWEAVWNSDRKSVYAEATQRPAGEKPGDACPTPILEPLEKERTLDDLKRLIDTANAPIIGIDSFGRIDEWNQSAEKLTGFRKDEAMGRDLVGEFITDDYKAAVREVLDKALLGIETSNYEFPLFTKSGDRLDVLLNSTTRRDARGNVIGVVGVGQNITELAKARAEQERTADDLTRLIDTANAPIIGIDSSGHINEWNQSAEKLTGFRKDEAMGRDLVGEFITDDYKAAVREVLDRALLGIETSNYEFPLFTKSGKEIYLLLNATSRRAKDATILGVIGIGQDISERKASERMKAEFVSVVSHELRTPLSSISGSLRLMEEGLVGELPPEAFELAEIASRNCGRLIRLVNDILDLEKLQAGMVKLRPRECSLAAMTAKAIASVEGLALSEGVSIEQVGDFTGTVVADEDRIIQVVTNLLGNAIKFTPAGTAIRLEHLELENGAQRISVTDEGPGLQATDREMVFDKFRQLDSSDSRAKGGTGLGLAISKSIVDQHGGSIGVESPGDGGARFWFVIPPMAVALEGDDGVASNASPQS